MDIDAQPDLEAENNNASGSGTPIVPETPALPRGRGRPKGSKNKPKGLPGAAFSMDFGEGTFGTVVGPPVKRGRGRPKGSKNKPGHKAGRPGRGVEAEDESPAPKRARSETPAQNLPLPLADLQQHLQQQLNHNNGPHLDSDAIAGDIPVDPSLTASRSDNNTSVIANTGVSSNQTPYFGLAGTDAESTTAALAYFHRARDPVLPHFKIDVKGKGVSVPSTPVSADASIGGVIRNLLPKEAANSALPQVSGPFQLVEVDGRRRLDGPVPASVFEAQTGPVYVYIANYQPGLDDPAVVMPSASGGGGPPAASLASWRITHPLTSDGKPRERGPRKCGYCGKYECRGRGGRQWCPENKSGSPGTAAKEEAEDASAADGAAPVASGSGSGAGAHAATNAPRAYSGLANFRGDVGNPSTPSPGGGAVQGGSNQYATDGAADDVADSVLSLIQSILPSTSNPNDQGASDGHHVANFVGPPGGSSDGANDEYRDPGAPSSSVPAFPDALNFGKQTSADGNGAQEAREGGSAEKEKKARKPRSCKICQSTECPGRTVKTKCAQWVEPTGTS